MNYRREIDGLRALAVLAVMLFHAGFEVFGGGYVGVDVFFVISGYLITTIILSDLERGSFSIADFYERRARRILPALFFVMIVCVPFAWLWLLPDEMREFARSLVAVSVFASNILFWRESGYFDTAAELKPLLHTWSLAVEEQYYVLFPLALMLIWRFGKRWVLCLLAIVAITSLTLAEIGSSTSPVAAFYLLPARVWELMIGAFAAFYLMKPNRMGFGKSVYEVGAALGLALVLYAVFCFNSKTPFPGIYALVPTMGAVLLIVFATNKTMIGRLIGAKVFVAVGLISYSAYLWHQPLFAFSRIRYGSEIDEVLMFSLIGLSLLLAIPSLWFIERPFRNKKKISSKVLLRGSVLAFLGISGVAVAVLGTPITYAKYDARELQVLEARERNRDYIKNRAYDRHGCFFDQSQLSSVLIKNQCVRATGGERIILFGDSEAAHYFYGLTLLQDEYKFAAMQFTGASCRAVSYPGNSQRCEEFYRLFMEEVVPGLSSSDTVVVASNWWNTYKLIGEQDFSVGLRKSVRSIRSSGASVILVGNTPDFLDDPYEQLVRLRPSGDVVMLPVHDYSLSDSVIRNVASEENLSFYEPTKYLCNQFMCRFKDDVDYLTFDRGHLSSYGSKLLAREILVSLAAR